MKPLLVIDTETGGLNPKEHALLEIGACLLINGEIWSEHFDSLVQPRVGKLIEPQALEVNGIQMEKILRAPAHDVVNEQWEAFIKKVMLECARCGYDPRSMMLASWNSAFDGAFLCENDFWRPSESKMFCIWSFFHAHRPEGARLYQAAAEYGVLQLPSHRALSDAITAARVCNAVAEERWG